MVGQRLNLRTIETIPIRVDLPLLYRGSHYRMPRRCTIITRVHTDQGIVGECYNADADSDQAEIIRIIQEELFPLLQGEDILAPEACWERMRSITLDQLRDRRLALQAIACVDSAIWDAIGKALGIPLYKLWGGYRASMPVIGIGGYYTEDHNSLENEVSFFSDHGFHGMKFKVGGLSPEADAQRLKIAVDTARADFMFLVDANQAWTPSDAIEFVRRIADHVELRWFEEPCQWPYDLAGMRQVRARTEVPVAAGQSEITIAAMLRLMQDGAIDISNFDASWGGGPTAWQRVAALAEAFCVELAHHEEAQLASHLLASVPHGTYVELFHPDRDPIYWRMLANRPEVKEQNLALPEAGGLGWTLDEEFIAYHRADH